jgi:hypothetical protein
MSGQIFISYRRDESRWSAGRLYDRLAARFDRNQIFMDVDAIALGENFLKAIEKRVGECDVLIAVIGTHWLTSTDEQGGRRLDNSEDFVRMEIATALRRDIRVIPVLVDGALMPRSTGLPDDLKQLVYRNALQVGDTHFDDDCRRLVAAIEQVLEEKERLEREERERLEAERRQKEGQDRLETERRETEKEERLEVERRQNEEQAQLETEQRQREETGRIAQCREREQRERAAAEIRERQEKELLDARPRENEEKDRLETEQLEQKRLENERLEAELKTKNKEPPARSNFIAIDRLASVVCYILGVLFAIYGISWFGKPDTWGFTGIPIGAFFVLAGFLIWKRTVLKK